MPVQHRTIVFDTNAYRDLRNRPAWPVAQLRSQESQKHLVPYANPSVIMELASHLWDVNDPDYAECRSAMSLLYQHCVTANAKQLRVIADSESLVAQMLYQETPPGYAESTEQLSRLAQTVATTPEGNILKASTTEKCQKLAAFIEDREKDFVSDVRDHVILQMNPACQGWNPFENDPMGRQEVLAFVRSSRMSRIVARAHVIKTRLLLGKPANAPELEEMADFVKHHCSASIDLYLEILQRIVNTGCNLTKSERPNWIWDVQIALAIGEKIGDTPLPLVLITGDGDIEQAAYAASLASFVLSLDQYLAQLAI